MKVFNLDLAAAGIATRDEETMRVNKVDGGGRTLDLHSLRHSFATLPGRSGASLQVAQVAMRHSDPKLTATTNTHLEMVDVGRALDALPELPMKASDSVAPNGCTSRWQYVQFGVMR